MRLCSLQISAKNQTGRRAVRRRLSARSWRSENRSAPSSLCQRIGGKHCSIKSTMLYAASSPSHTTSHHPSISTSFTQTFNFTLDPTSAQSTLCISLQPLSNTNKYITAQNRKAYCMLQSFHLLQVQSNIILVQALTRHGKPRSLDSSQEPQWNLLHPYRRRSNASHAFSSYTDPPDSRRAWGTSRVYPWW